MLYDYHRMSTRFSARAQAVFLSSDGLRVVLSKNRASYRDAGTCSLGTEQPNDGIDGIGQQKHAHDEAYDS